MKSRSSPPGHPATADVAGPSRAVRACPRPAARTVETSDRHPGHAAALAPSAGARRWTYPNRPEDRYTQAVAILEDALVAAATSLPAQHARLLACATRAPLHCSLAATSARRWRRSPNSSGTTPALSDRAIQGRSTVVSRPPTVMLSSVTMRRAGRVHRAARPAAPRAGDRGAEVLELRHQVGILLLAANRLPEASQVLRPFIRRLPRCASAR